jgi:4-hydroxy-tetrahydrodipicolinate reductase
VDELDGIRLGIEYHRVPAGDMTDAQGRDLKLVGLALAMQVMQTFRRKSELLTGPAHGPIQPHQLQVSSLRVGHVTGRHAVVFDSEADTIELIHTARSRRGFALGALAAATWLKGRTGVYTMRDVILG